ncbi:two-component system sensor histidine kinase RegB [Aureimonas pseudogalii]|uniref:histidine kinase n=2 Tax=Aureimonas pseudogalii TaxID=1744844 RepID=A0A7W6H431_9HYPH|nr:two-component system sensor histidine kinase RegB [Aureimonas pseudogalii]
MTRSHHADFEPGPSWSGRASNEGQRMRLATLTRLRWLSIAGQTAACVFVAWGLWYPYPVFLCFGLIALSIALNLVLSVRFPKSERLETRQVAAILAFDILQPTGLLFLTGGIQNPFAIFLIVPAMTAAATQPPATTIGLGILAVLAATALAFLHMPMPWPVDWPFALPLPYLGGMWFALVTTLLFATFYIYRVAAEARTLSDALAATELVLQREQHLSALDGLAAAAAHELGTPLATIALVAKEMGRSTPAADPMREDVDLLITQTERCRGILRQLTSLSSSSEEHLARHSFLSLVEEVVAPHRDFGVTIHVHEGTRIGPEPVLRRNAGIVYGLGNIVENAVDFAASEVSIALSWDGERIDIDIVDDGSGFPADVLARIGDPYMAQRETGPRNSGGGLGLGLFIAKTLLERSGARIVFGNRPEADRPGALVAISWPREAFGRASDPRGELVLGESDPFMALPSA